MSTDSFKTLERSHLCFCRVAGAGFELRSVNYTLSANNGEHSLHGGARGWDRRVWNSEWNGRGVVFSRLSSDGEEVGEPCDKKCNDQSHSTRVTQGQLWRV